MAKSRRVTAIPMAVPARQRPPATEALDLAAFQNSIAATFGSKDSARGLPATFMYLMEEIGELAEALREPDRHDLAGEFADCLAWLCSLADLAQVDLASAARAKYGSECPRCQRSPCVCSTKP